MLKKDKLSQSIMASNEAIQSKLTDRRPIYEQDLDFLKGKDSIASQFVRTDKIFGNSSLYPELLNYNVGQGAFHVARVKRDSFNKTKPFHLVFDCGTKNGTQRFRQARPYWEIGTDPELLVVSHYHDDHYSKIGELAKHLNQRLDFSARQEPLPIFLPKIDPRALTQILRMLVLGSIIKYGNYVFAEKDIKDVFKRRDMLSFKLRKWFDGICDIDIRFIERHDSTLKEYEWRDMVTVHSPPQYDDGVQKILGLFENELRHAFSIAEFKDAVEKTVKLIIDLVGDEGVFRAFQQYLEEDGVDEDPRTVLNRLGNQVLLALFSPEFNQEGYENTERNNRTLRILLGLIAAVPAKQLPGIRIVEYPKVIGAIFKTYKLKLNDLIHLFNISISVKPDPRLVPHEKGDGRLLLTGDAHPYLWELLRRDLDAERRYDYSAVQVPHHGSVHNINRDMYAMIDCPSFVVSADGYRRWKHPSSELGTALKFANLKNTERKLYCTNVKKDCQLADKNNPCPKKKIIAVSLSKGVSPSPQSHRNILGDDYSWLDDGKYWLIDFFSQKAESCPNV